MDKEKFIKGLPVWGQNLLQSYFGMKSHWTLYNKQFHELLQEYLSHNEWSYEQKCDYRDKQLRKFVRHCYETVPYYKKIFNEGGINPDSIRTVDDLKVLPILSKDIVVEQQSNFESNAVDEKDLTPVHTSGTTGSGFVFKSTNHSFKAQQAVWWRYYYNLGLNINQPYGCFHHTLFISPEINTPPFYRLDRVRKVVYFSSFHMNRNNLDSYIEGIKKFDLKWVQGWPSILDEFANFLIDNGMQIKMDMVTTGAENLLGEQSDHIEKAFGVRPYQHYGQMEAVANFSQNLERKMFVDEDFSAVEFVPIEGEDNLYEIVGTNFTNYATPLLRYKTKDVCSMVETPQGRLITRLDGRLEDFILLPNGTKTRSLYDLFYEFDTVKESQVVQDTKDHIIVRIVKRDNYSDKDESVIADRVRRFLPGLLMDFEYVDVIPKTRSGKIRHIVSLIK